MDQIQLLAALQAWNYHVGALIQCDQWCYQLVSFDKLAQYTVWSTAQLQNTLLVVLTVKYCKQVLLFGTNIATRFGWG